MFSKNQLGFLFMFLSVCSFSNLYHCFRKAMHAQYTQVSEFLRSRPRFIADIQIARNSKFCCCCEIRYLDVFFTHTVCISRRGVNRTSSRMNVTSLFTGIDRTPSREPPRVRLSHRIFDNNFFNIFTGGQLASALCSLQHGPAPQQSR